MWAMANAPVLLIKPIDHMPARPKPRDSLQSTLGTAFAIIERLPSKITRLPHSRICDWVFRTSDR